MIQASESERVYVEILLGIPRSKSTVRMRPEVVRFWDELTAEVKQMRADGKSFLIPNEFPSVASTEGTQAPDLRAQPRKPNGQFDYGSDSGGGGDSGGGSPAGGGDGAPAAAGGTAEPYSKSKTGGEKYAEQTQEKMRDEQASAVGDAVMSSKERGALNNYTAGEHKNINKAARGAPPPPLEGKNLVKNEKQAAIIDGVIQRSPLTSAPIVVERGVNIGALGVGSKDEIGTLVGSEFTDMGIISTSLSSKTAGTFQAGTKATTMVINVPKGSRAYAVPQELEYFNFGKSEYEVLLPRGTKFKITNYDKGKNEVYVDVVG